MASSAQFSYIIIVLLFFSLLERVVSEIHGEFFCPVVPRSHDFQILDGVVAGDLNGLSWYLLDIAFLW